MVPASTSMSRNDGVGHVNAQLRHRKRAAATPRYPQASAASTTATSTASASTRLTSPARRPWYGRAGAGTIEPGTGRAARQVARAGDGGSSVSTRAAGRDGRRPGHRRGHAVLAGQGLAEGHVDGGRGDGRSAGGV